MDSGGKSKRPKLKIPYYPASDDKGHYEVASLNYKIVADYANVSIFDVQEMDIFSYWFLLREAAIYQYSQTEDGRKYLNNCWRLEQTQPDKDKLRAKFGKGENYGR